jgi:dipeptide/tripeptide permease
MTEPEKKTLGAWFAATFKETADTFRAFSKAPRALWGVNVSYFLEGFVYFGMLGYLAMFFNENVGLSDQAAGVMVGVLTWGITFSMFLFGGLADKWGVRTALLLALVLMLLGRAIIASGPLLGLAPDGLWSAIHLMTLAGIFFIVLGYGMYQPAAYAAVRQMATPEQATMGYAMLYALMNLGGWLPSFFSPVRKAYGISGAYWVYTGLTVLGIVLTFFILTKKVTARAIAEAKEAKAKADAAAGKAEAPKVEGPAVKPPFSLVTWLKTHPLADARFAFFIFCLIPVQTLFAHNWLTLPMYVERAFRGTAIGDNFEFTVNLNPLLIFILVPIVAALTQRAKVYTMMIIGTLVMALPTFLLALGPSPYTLYAFLLFMTIGEAMWQPRFLQYAAEIAPEGKTAMYMGVAQFPWFMTKMITSLYSGWFLARYCADPATGAALNTEFMWFVYALIALSSSVMLILAKPWMTRGKGLQTT